MTSFVQTFQVSLQDLVVDDSFNSRIHYSKDDLRRLAEDMTANGQLTPILVSKHDKGWFLVGGFRRYNAAKLAGMKLLIAQAVTGSGKDLALTNIRENIARADLTTYEKARACMMLRETHKMTYQQIADKLGGHQGMSVAHVQRLVGNLQKLHPEILAAWSNPDDPKHNLCSLNYLDEIKSFTQEEQALKWAEKSGTAPVTGGETGPSNGNGENPAKAPVPPMASRKEILVALDVLHDTNVKGAAGAIAALEWAAGIKKTIRLDGQEVWSERQAEAAAAAAKREAEAEKEAEKLKRQEEKAKAKLAEIAEQRKAVTA